MCCKLHYYTQVCTIVIKGLRTAPYARRRGVEITGAQPLPVMIEGLAGPALRCTLTAIIHPDLSISVPDRSNHADRACSPLPEGWQQDGAQPRRSSQASGGPEHEGRRCGRCHRCWRGRGRQRSCECTGGPKRLALAQISNCVSVRWRHADGRGRAHAVDMSWGWPHPAPSDMRPLPIPPVRRAG